MQIRQPWSRIALEPSAITLVLVPLFEREDGLDELLTASEVRFDPSEDVMEPKELRIAHARKALDRIHAVEQEVGVRKLLHLGDQLLFVAETLLDELEGRSFHGFFRRFETGSGGAK